MGDKLVSLAGAVSQGSTCRASTAAHNVTAWGWRELGMVEHSEEEQGELQAVCRAGEGSEGEGQDYTEVWPVLGSCGDWSRELGSFFAHQGPSGRCFLHPVQLFPQEHALLSCCIEG